MKEWYCVVQGQRYGPVAESVLRDWIRQGRVQAHDSVWSQGMAGWVPAGSAMPDMFPGWAGVGYARPMPGLVPLPPPGGTGGQVPNGELTSRALSLLAGNWGLPIGFCVLSSLIGMAIGLIPYISGIVQLILQGPLQLGVAVFFITFARKGPCALAMLFVGFKNFGCALAANLLMALFVLGWMLLFSSIGIVVFIVAAVAESPELAVLGGVLTLPGVVAGVIAGLSYSQTLYLIADDNRLGPLQAIRRSKELMRGSKAKLFCLGLIFFCWGLLCLLTCGIGFLWLGPYMGVSYGCFYDDLQPPRQPEQMMTPA